MSGQLVNFHKPAFQCTQNNPPELINMFAHILQMDEALSLGNYWACPIINGKVTNATFGDVQERFSSQLAKWRANSLFQAGRTILIQSNLAPKANYQM